MLSRRISLRLLAGILIFSFAGQAFADTVQGTVAKASRSVVDMNVYDAQGRPYPNTLHLTVDRSTRFSGFSSPTMLRKMDPVTAHVRQRSGAWYADSIGRFQVAGNVRPPTTAPSPSLMDALKSPTGQKVIRNGLTGAITGAVASGTSGGKAGKGALIGAAVGAAGGLLMDLFGQRQQQQAQPAKVYTQEDQRN